MSQAPGPPPGLLPPGPPPGPPRGLPPFGSPPETPGQAAPRRNKAALVIAVVASVLVVALAVAVPFALQRHRDDRRQERAGAANLDALVVYEDLRSDHTEDEVDYEMTPPAGGSHDRAWLECGAYDEPVRDENAVHDLEHGAVWIAYDPGLDDDDVEALVGALPDNGIMSPYDDLSAPVVLTVWERQLELSGADDPRLGLFLAAYGDGHTSPEPFASCAGGVREGSDGPDTTTV